MHALHKTAFLILKLGDKNFTAIQGIADNLPESIFAAFQTFCTRRLPNLFRIKFSLGNFFEAPSEYRLTRLFRGDKLPSIFFRFVFIPDRGQPHITPLFLCPPHAIENIQRPPVIFHLRSGQVKSQHHLIFRDGQIKRLFYRLRLHPKATKYIDHLICIACIAAETVPFGKQLQVDTILFLFEFLQKVFPCRPVKRFR
ncbi:MAG: hypothetical protein A1D16_06295 [Flavihumibacter sp. CACIAM 22H1]|nr:MAG: hypothetical protein A1D16_06295 [Flavihumibacter sp. CACIAM 22H1]